MKYDDVGRRGLPAIPKQLSQDVAWAGRLPRSLFRAARSPLALPDASGARFAVLTFFARHDPVALRDPILRGALMRGRG